MDASSPTYTEKKPLLDLKKTSKLREDYLRGGFDRSLFPRVFVSLGVVVLLIVRRITGDLYFTRRVRLKQKQIIKLGTTVWEGEKCRNCGGVIKQFSVFKVTQVE